VQYVYERGVGGGAWGLVVCWISHFNTDEITIEIVDGRAKTFNGVVSMY
jgi:hypothetical protein